MSASPKMFVKVIDKSLFIIERDKIFDRDTVVCNLYDTPLSLLPTFIDALPERFRNNQELMYTIEQTVSLFYRAAVSDIFKVSSVGKDKKE
jgi:hypothetical protein